MAMATGRYFALLMPLNLLWLATATIQQFGAGEPLFSAAVFAGPTLASLIVFHLILLQRGDRITQVEADSIYYLGFLITLSVLVCTVFDFIKTANSSVIVSVGSKFALGLISTGYGLFGRLTLQARILDEDGISTKLDEFAENIAKINDRLADSSVRLDQLVSDVVEQAKELGRKSTVETIRVISDELGPAVNDLKTLITEVNRSLGRFKDGRFQDLADASSQLATGFESAAEKLPLLSHGIGAASSALGGIASTAGELGSAASAAGGQVIALGESVSKASQTMTASVGVVNSLNNAASQTRDMIVSLASSIAGLNTDLDALAKRSVDLSAEMSSAGASVKVLGVALDEVPTRILAAGFSAIATSITLVQGSIANFAVELESMAGRPNDALLKNAAQIELTASTMNDAAVELGLAMTRLAVEIRKAADLAKAG